MLMTSYLALVEIQTQAATVFLPNKADYLSIAHFYLYDSQVDFRPRGSSNFSLIIMKYVIRINNTWSRRSFNFRQNLISHW